MYKVNNLYKVRFNGDLDIFSASHEDASEDPIARWQEICIHGNPEGLRSLAGLLLQLADADQEADAHIPVGAAEHVTLYPGQQLAASSDTVTIGRLDRKGTGAYYARFVPKPTASGDSPTEP